jgi:hypothetical protein
VLRTQELAALHRFDGAEQYFTRAVDFGYSFSIDETFEKWGKDEITGDYVRLIRMIRPDAVFAMSPTGDNGANTTTRRRALATPISWPATRPNFEQIKVGLRPWQPKKFYYSAVGQGRCIHEDDAGQLVGNARCSARPTRTSEPKPAACTRQGMAQLLALPGPATRNYQRTECTIWPDAARRALADRRPRHVDRGAGAARRCRPRPCSTASTRSAAVQAAQKKFDTESDVAAVQPLVTGSHRSRRRLATSRSRGARFEIEFRLRQKEREFQQALIAASGVRVEALADDGIVVPGQDVSVSLVVANRGTTEVAVKQIKFDGFANDAACTLTQVTGQNFGRGGRGGRGRAGRADAPPPPPPVVVSSLKRDVVGRCDPKLTIPRMRASPSPTGIARARRRYTFDDDAPFGLPFRPTSFYAQVTLGFPSAGGGQAVEEVIDGLPVQYRYQGDIFSGDKRSDLLVVPALSVRVSPEVAIVPSASLRPAATAPAAPAPAAPRAGARRGAPPAAPPPAAAVVPPPAPNASREVRVTVVNGSPSAAEGVVTLEMPKGWTATPPEQPPAAAHQSQTLCLTSGPRPVRRPARITSVQSSRRKARPSIAATR